MILQSETLDRARLLLTDASNHAGSPLQSDEIEALAFKIAFAVSVEPATESHIGKITNRSEGPPSLALAKSMASRFRNALEVGHIDPLFDLPAMLGEKLRIDLFPVEQDHVLGGCTLIGGAAFIFLPHTRRIADLFICAHELGHLLLISIRKNSEGAVFDVPQNGVSSIRSPQEYFADAFARELLVPSQGLGIALQETRKQLNVSGGPIGDIELLYLSRIFGVSFLAIAKRCEESTLLPEGGAVALYRFLVEEFGGPEKRADMLELPPRREVEIPSVPYSLQLATIQRIREDSMAIQQAPSAGSLDPRMSRKLA
jgi:IrrE N-terminal-like domain